MIEKLPRHEQLTAPNHNSMPGVSQLPSHIKISDSLTMQKLVPSDDVAVFNMIERNPDIRENVAFAKDIKTLDDVLPNLRSRSNETFDGRYAVVDHSGFVGSSWAFPGDKEGEFGIGYCLDRAVRGSGYATLAAKEMMERLRSIGATEVYFQIIIGNDSSAAVPERLGCRPAEIVMGTDFPVEQQRFRKEL